MAKLQSPRGTHDFYGDDILKFNHIAETTRTIAADFGFDEISTPIFEFSPVFMKTLGDSSDIVNKEMYTFEDRGGEKLTLRPEGTAGVTRAFISNGLTRNIPLKWYYQGPMFRYERPQKGRTRQFHQFGVEILGAKDFKHDIDCISLAHYILKALCPSKDIQLEINSIGDNESRNTFKAKLVEYLTPFTSELSEDSQKRLKINPLRILDSKNEHDQKICQDAPKLQDCFNSDSQKIYDDILTSLETLGIPYSKNSQLVRGLDYYSHCVFEFKSDELGAQNTVLAGGRYNQLIEMMGGPELSGVGFGAGFERLMYLTEVPQNNRVQTAVLELSPDASQKCIDICYQLRKSGFACEIIDSGNMSKKMKKADKIKAQFALLIGDDEVKNKQATLKNLKTGDQQQIDFDKIISSLKNDL